MFTSAELIEALRRRRRRSLRPPPPPGEFPPGWRDWFSAIAARPGLLSGAPAEDIVAIMAAREPAVSGGLVAQLGRWRAFTTFWRQDWQPASRDERWMRVAATSASLLLHLLFMVTLALLMFTRFHFPAAAEDARDGEEHVLQVEYIGQGTPEDAGGGAPAAPVDTPAEPAPAAPAAPSAAADVAAPAPEPVAAATQPPPEAPEDTMPVELPLPLPVRELVVEVPQLASPSVEALQDLQVTEVDVPDSRFEVPPPRDLDVVDVPVAAMPDVSVRQRDIDLRETGQVQLPAPRPLRELEVAVPQASPRAVVERRIDVADTAGVTLQRPGALAETAARELAVDAPSARVRDVPMPSARPAQDATGGATRASDGTDQASSSTPGQADDGTGAATSALPPGGRPDANQGARGTASAPGAGPQAGQPPGAMPSTRASDDWGDSARNVPGGQVGTPGASGLFNADGSPRLAGGGRVGGGLPPGVITEDFENIDRHGTWLKRPPYDYEPTAFDRFWMPGETLLEEWVRRSVTEVRIPIPGTTKTIRCVTVMLALGGACDIEDPNLQEEPTHGRPAPEIPFKRELQEDQESLGPAPPPGD